MLILIRIRIRIMRLTRSINIFWLVFAPCAPLEAKAKAVEDLVRHFQTERVQSERWSTKDPCEKCQSGDHSIVDHLEERPLKTGTHSRFSDRSEIDARRQTEVQAGNNEEKLRPGSLSKELPLLRGGTLFGGFVPKRDFLPRWAWRRSKDDSRNRLYAPCREEAP